MADFTPAERHITSMAQAALQQVYGYGTLQTLSTSYAPPAHTSEAVADTGAEWHTGSQGSQWQRYGGRIVWEDYGQPDVKLLGLNSTGKGILIGMLSAFGSAALVGLIIAIVYFFRFTSRGRIFLDRIGRPGEFDDEQSFLREEEDALAEMDDLQRAEYFRAKGKFEMCG